MISLLRRVFRHFRPVVRVIPEFKVYLPFLSGKTGLEIGGPSPSFQARSVVPLYPVAGSIDNCDFSDSTVWAAHQASFVYSPDKPAGRSFFCEGSKLTPIADASYDFVASSHNLEHFANPVKALYEWKRVLRPGGALVLLLPYYRNTFDHQRTPTPVSHLFDDFRADTGEDDRTHLAEILEKHDLARDPPAGTLAEFRERSEKNIDNRCLHHHVFDEHNSRQLLEATGFDVVSMTQAEPFHLCVLARL